ncbi:MAG TPA: hypothetical protein VGB59_00980 [Allosphingosinicella sp.]
MSADELRRKAADLRSLADGCKHPEGVDLLHMLAAIHDQDADEAEQAPLPPPAAEGPSLSA